MFPVTRAKATATRRRGKNFATQCWTIVDASSSSTRSWHYKDALTRLLQATVKIFYEGQLAYRPNSKSPPPDPAGKRTVALPSFLITEIDHHLETFVDREPDADVFTSPRGAPLDRNNWTKRFRSAVI